MFRWWEIIENVWLWILDTGWTNVSCSALVTSFCVKRLADRTPFGQFADTERSLSGSQQPVKWFLKEYYVFYPLNLKWDNSDKEAQAPGGAALEEHHEGGETARGVTSVLSPVSLGKMRYKSKINRKIPLLLLWFLNIQ